MVLFGAEASLTGAFFVDLAVLGSGVDAEHPEDGFFFVAAISTGVDADGGKLAAFAPALDGKGRDAKKLGNLRDGEKIREIVEI